MRGCSVAQLLSGARLAEDAAKAVGVGAQHLLVLRQRRIRLVELEQQIGKQLTRREDRRGGDRMLIHCRFEIGRRSDQFDRLRVVALDMGKDAGSPQAVNLDLIGPVGVLAL